MRILVTGGAGFIGSHVTDAYIAAGHEVWVLDNMSRGKPENVNHHAHLVQMDLRSPALKDLFAELQFDCVNHHAAQVDVRVSVADPLQDAAVNISGSLNLLEAVRAHGLPRVIFASTGGAIYGEQRRFPADEEHPTAPMSPYGIAKLAVEHYLRYYAAVHRLRYTVLRYANVYGPRQDPDGEAGVVAIFCGRALRRQLLTVYGEGSQTRDYVYVKDVARASLLALQYLMAERTMTSRPLVGNGKNGTPHLPVFNIGTGVETSVNALVALVLEAADADCSIAYQPARAGEQLRSAIDPQRAAAELGWKPETELCDGLTESLSWFRTKTTIPEPIPQHLAAVDTLLTRETVLTQ